MDLVVSTTFKNEPINLIIEDFDTESNSEVINFTIETVLVLKKGKWIERTIDFIDEKSLDRMIDKVTNIYKTRGWLNVSEII